MQFNSGCSKLAKYMDIHVARYSSVVYIQCSDTGTLFNDRVRYVGVILAAT